MSNPGTVFSLLLFLQLAGFGLSCYKLAGTFCSVRSVSIIETCFCCLSKHIVPDNSILLIVWTCFSGRHARPHYVLISR